MAASNGAAESRCISIAFPFKNLLGSQLTVAFQSAERTNREPSVIFSYRLSLVICFHYPARTDQHLPAAANTFADGARPSPGTYSFSYGQSVVAPCKSLITPIVKVFQNFFPVQRDRLQVPLCGNVYTTRWSRRPGKVYDKFGYTLRFIDRN